MNEKELTKLFYRHCRAVNKRKFIEIMSRKVAEEQQKEGGIHLPPMIYANDAYNQFKSNGYFDEYGRLKQMPQLLEGEV